MGAPEASIYWPFSMVQGSAARAAEESDKRTTVKAAVKRKDFRVLCIAVTPFSRRS